MRLIVPLQGLIAQGRRGLVLGSVIPCALFCFFQLYLKRNRSPPPPPPPPSSDPLPELSRISRPHLSPRGVAQASVSSCASSVTSSSDSPYHIGLEKVAANPYDALGNPNGVIQLGLAENKLSLDLVRGWIASHLKDLCISGTAAYQPFDELKKLKTDVIYISSNPVFHERTKLIEVDCHFIREKIKAQEIVIPHVHIADQLADVLTKALPRDRHMTISFKLGLSDIFGPILRGSVEGEAVKGSQWTHHPSRT